MHEMSNKHDNFSNFGSAIERISCTSTAPARQQRCAEVHKVSFELSHLRKRSTALVVILCDLMSLQLLCSMSCTSASRNMHDYYTAHQCSKPCRKVWGCSADRPESAGKCYVGIGFVVRRARGHMERRHSQSAFAYEARLLA